MKYKITMPEAYKKYFTLGDMDEIKRIKADPELDELITDALKVAAAGGEVLKVVAEWGYNHSEPETVFFGNAVDIYFTVYVLHEFDRFEIVHASLTGLYSKPADDLHTGFGEVYTFAEKFGY